jgi:hypothetical protein
MIEACPDCGHTHPYDESCVCPEAPFYAVCADEDYEAYSRHRYGNEYPAPPGRKTLLWAVPCSTRVERSVVYSYMQMFFDSHWWLGRVPGKDTQGAPRHWVILATEMLDHAMEWVSPEKLRRIKKDIKELEDCQRCVYGRVLPNLIEEREEKRAKEAKKRKKKAKRTPVIRRRNGTEQ